MSDDLPINPVRTFQSYTYDLVIIHPGAAHGIMGNHPIYGDLGETLTAIEQPLWARLIAGYVRNKGFSVRIIDAEAEGLSPFHAAMKAWSYRPRLVCIAVYGHQPSASTQQMVAASATAKSLKNICPAPIIMVGGHVSALPVKTMQEETIDYACVGEGPVTIVGLLQVLAAKPVTKFDEIPGLVWQDQYHGDFIINKSAELLNVDELQGKVWDDLPMQKYRSHNWQAFATGMISRQPYAAVYTSLGCPYKCLAGDTLVNTIYGHVPIKELAKRFGDKGVPVYTFDPKTKKAFISASTHIRKYGKSRLVRVNFDDGTHIDCTPDHKFLQFKWSNGKGGGEGKQWECEAQDLKKGAHVRALRFEFNEYMYVNWSRRGRRHRSRMVMDYLKGRKLTRKEHVHHIDKNKTNDLPHNLEYCASAKEHFSHHPELSERMRSNNPTKNMTPEWRAKINKGLTGLRRSEEAIENYRVAAQLRSSKPEYIEKLCKAAREREARLKGKKWWTTPGGVSYVALQAKAPNDILGRINFNPWKNMRGNELVNHRVVSVEKLRGQQDVYCLTVPETGWFYANNVLVKNCSFCMINSIFQSNRYRMRKPEDVVAEVQMLYRRYGVKTFKIIDEMFVLNEKHYTAIANGLIESGIADDINIWAYARVDTVRPDRLSLLRRAGIRWLALGIESGSKYVRDGASKRLKNDDIEEVVRAIQAADINVIGNYIFGLPDDTMESMSETLNLALKLNTEFANFYSAQAYPGSPLYDQAIKEGWELPETWAGYSQHNEWARPLDTKYVHGAQVLHFRDEAFNIYFTNPAYLEMIEKKFGLETLEHVKGMTKYKLKRKLVDQYFAQAS